MTSNSSLPQVIQGGMGIAVSDWRLARQVALHGQMGVVSGTAINSVLIRRLQDGDPGGWMTKALAAFPVPEIAEKIRAMYFIPGGKAKTAAYKRSAMFALESPLPLLQLTVVSCFAEVWLAKHGHNGVVGLNLLEKIQLPNLACLYGAMLADVDYVLMGAGIPREIPGILDLFSQNQPAMLKIAVVGASEEYVTRFDPERVMEGKAPKTLKRPMFFPIVSSAALAKNLMKKATGKVNGFIVEGPLAGGHNAPPRGTVTFNDLGEPIYGPRDEVRMEDMAELGLPFYMAGSTATPEILQQVLAAGGAGIQVGTLFAFSEDSGLDPVIRSEVLDKIARGERPPNGWVYTDPNSSPTGFPFKAVRLAGTLANQDVYETRRRICDLGYLRHAYLDTKNDRVGYRCPAEPVADYIKKAGTEEETQGKKCLCNALMADIGMGQVQPWGRELPLLTAGDDLNLIARVLKPNQNRYTAADVIDYLTQNKTVFASAQSLQESPSL